MTIALIISILVIIYQRIVINRKNEEFRAWMKAYHNYPSEEMNYPSKIKFT